MHIKIFITLWLSLNVQAFCTETTLTFLHFNDIYQVQSVEGWGGIAELAHAISKARQDNPNSIVVISGDFLSPSSFSAMTKGRHMIDLFNSMGIDVVGLGNHEFDFGSTILQQRIAESTFPCVCTTIYDDHQKLTAKNLYSYYIKEVGCIKVGFLGLLTPRTKELASNSKSITIIDPVESAKKGIVKLKSMGADVIVAITHMDIADDINLAREAIGIDLILGGHDHYPVTYYKKDVLIHKSGTDGRFLGIIKLNLINDDAKSNKHTIVPSWCMQPIYKGIADKATLKIVDCYEALLQKDFSKAVAKASIELDGRHETVRSSESSLGDLFADALKEAYSSDAALLNGGAIRGNKLYQAGEILTRGSIFGELPFNDVAIITEVTGNQLKATIEHGLSRLPKDFGGFLQISGLKVIYNPHLPVGKRVIAIEVAGAPIHDLKKYKVVTTSFMAMGGDGYSTLPHVSEDEIAKFGVPLTPIVIEQLEKLKNLHPQGQRYIVGE